MTGTRLRWPSRHWPILGRSLLIYSGAWIAVAVLTSAHVLLVYSAEGPVSSSTVRYVAISSSGYWFAWAGGGIVAVLAAHRFPVAGDRWWGHFLVHAALAFAVAGLVLIPYRQLRFWADLPPRLDFTADYVFRLGTGILTYSIIVGLVSAIELRRRAKRARLEAAGLSAHLTRARLDVLLARIRPHFLYNTIHGIQALVTEDPRKAEEMLGELGTVLRWATDAPDAAEVPLAQELRVVEAYLRIQTGRFGERLEVRMDVEPEASWALVPPLILQPLVENAIEHGVANQKTGGLVRVLARKEGEVLRIRVLDDGPGMEGPSACRDGVGLATTRSRLETQYGKGASVNVANRPCGGVEATLVLPFRVSQTEVA